MNKKNLSHILRNYRLIRTVGKINRASALVRRVSAVVTVCLLLVNIFGLIKSIPGR